MAELEQKEIVLDDNPGFDEEAHNQEMIDKVKNLENPGEDDGDPELPSEADLEEDGESGEEGESDEAGEEEALDALEDAGLDIDALRAEYEETGELSEDAYEALEAAGIPRETVDIYLDGVSAQVELLQMKAFNIVGGEENYQNLMKWAGDNLSEDEIEAFNETVSGNNFAQFQLAVQGLKAQYDAAYGSSEDNISGKPSATKDVYGSTAEMMEDMKDPRYQTDPAFQAKVASKLQRSGIL